MVQQKFVDRESELEVLEKEYKNPQATFFVLYGRRRVGKTELVLKFLKNKLGIYFLSTTEGDVHNIKAFQEKISNIIGEYFKQVEIKDWYTLFKFIIESSKFKEISKKQKFIIIIDEFPYLIHSNPNIPSIFQKIWDEILSKENIMLILCGSSVSVMENHILGYKSPLYGRRTAQLELQPLEFKYLREFFPNYSIEDLIKVWFVVGGTPAYLNKLDPKNSFWENVKEKILYKESYLYKEVEFLLVQEFREPKNYKLIFKAIALGNLTLGEICNYTGLDKSMVSKYLDVLTNLKLLKEITPVTASPKFKKRWYIISDPYFNFWFRYIYPNIIDLEAEQYDIVLSKIKNDFSIYSGFMFELLIEYLIRKRYFLKDISLTKVGKWWYKDKEIDVVCLNENTKEIIFCECKWSEKVNPYEICKDLVKNKIPYVDWYNDKRKEYIAIFAKSFKEKIDEFEGKKVYCFDLRDLESILNLNKVNKDNNNKNNQN